MSRLRMIVVPFVIFGLAAFITGGQAQKSDSPFQPIIPKTWDDEAMAAPEAPLANPVGSP